MNIRWFNAFAVATVLMAGLAAYSGSLSGPFIFDDPSSITDNPTIRHLWPPWDVLATPRANVTTQGRPLLNLSFAINYAISRTDVWSYHAVNLAIHLLAGLTLLGIVRRTLARAPLSPPIDDGDRSDHSPATFVSESPAAREMTAALIGLSVALLWTVHPLQTESVTYVVQRAESLMGLFYLLTIYGFIRYVESTAAVGRTLWALGSILTCLCGMATKEVMVSAPVIVLLYDRTFVAGDFLAAWRQRRGFYVALAGTWILLGLCVLRGGGTRGGAIGFGVGNGWWAYGLTQFEAIGRYLLLSFWPHPLVFEYGPFEVRRLQEVLPWAALVLPVLAGAIWAFWRKPVLGFLGACFLAPLAPTSLVPGTSQMIVEHRMYLSLAVVLVIAVWAGYSLMNSEAIALERPANPKRSQAQTRPSALSFAAWRRSTAVFLAFVLLLSAGLGWLTFERNTVYRTALGLWFDTVAKRPSNPLAHYMLAEELLAAGRSAEARQQLEEATRLHSSFYLAHERLGELLIRLGEPAAAAVHFETALRQRPNFADAHKNFAILLAQQGRTEEAVAHLQRALAISPDFPEAHLPLANALANLGKNAEAVPHFREALRLRPDAATAYNLANTLAVLQRHEEAIAHYRMALRLKPDYPAAEYNLANSLAASRRYEEAIVHYREALRLKPNDAAAEMNLGSVFFELGRLAEAEAQYLAALRLDPNSEETRANLERVRAAKRP